MKTIFALSICLVASATRSVAGANAVLITPDYLNQLAEEMRTNHPALQAAYARTNAAAANANAVRTWEDPTVRVGGMAAREAMRADEGDVLYGVEQKLPLFNKPGLARRVARAEFATEAAGAEAQFQNLRKELAKAAFRAALAEQVVAIGEQDLAWLDTMRQSLEGKQRSGQATLVEALQLENERGKRATQLRSERDALAHDQLSLNRFLNRDWQSPWPPLQLPPVAGPVFFNRRLLEFALKYEPKARTLRRQINQAEAMVDLTRRERLPDVSAGLDARNYSGDGSFRQGMLVLSVNLPWGNAGKYRSAIQREEARRQATELDLADYEGSLREEVHQLTVNIDAARRDALLYRDEIVPRSQSALESARTGWEGNANSFRDVLDARRMLLDARLMYVRAVAEQYQMLSELILCCGLGDLGALQMIGAEPDFKSGDKANEK